MIRPIKLGMKNWMFFGSLEAGENNSHSVVHRSWPTCRAQSLDPEDYLTERSTPPPPARCHPRTIGGIDTRPDRSRTPCPGRGERTGSRLDLRPSGIMASSAGICQRDSDPDRQADQSGVGCRSCEPWQECVPFRDTNRPGSDAWRFTMRQSKIVNENTGAHFRSADVVLDWLVGGVSKSFSKHCRHLNGTRKYTARRGKVCLVSLRWFQPVIRS